MNQSKKTQTYKNHSHYVPLYHYLTFAAMLALLIGGTYLVFTASDEMKLISYLFLLLVFTVISVSFHNRSFALKVQDRAVRAEENLRYFILTGKRLDVGLTIHQIIALRFADDEEFIHLVNKTIKENLSPTQIKTNIKNWRPDYHRA